jgi:hypothetical protein
MREVRYEHSLNLARLLTQLRASVLITTYQAGKLVVVGADHGQSALSFHNFERAMGLAVRRDRLALGTTSQVWLLRAAPDLASRPRDPRELETVVRKAMGEEPGSRYATAQELADDLRRFLESKPIRARRPGLTARVSKWARRNRAVVAAVRIGMLLPVFGLSIDKTRSDSKQTQRRGPSPDQS